MKIVFTAGCWDLFHIGHLNLLERAKELGDVLVVGVVTDELMAACKGPPIIPFQERLRIVGALECVDHVAAFESFTDYKAILGYGVNIRVVGPEYGKHQGQDTARRELVERGIEYVTLPRTPDVSTSKIKEACYEKLVCSGRYSCVAVNRLSAS